MTKIKIELKAISVKMVGKALEVITYEEPDITVTVEIDDTNVMAINQFDELVESIEPRKPVINPTPASGQSQNADKPISAQDVL